MNTPMQTVTIKTIALISLGLASILSCSCGKLETKQYTGDPITLEGPREPITLERPGYSNRPYKKQQVDTEPAATTPLNIQAVAEPSITAPAASPSIFNTPDDLSLPTENQISDRL